MSKHDYDTEQIFFTGCVGLMGCIYFFVPIVIILVLLYFSIFLFPGFLIELAEELFINKQYEDLKTLIIVCITTLLSCVIVNTVLNKKYRNYKLEDIESWRLKFSHPFIYRILVCYGITYIMCYISMIVCGILVNDLWTAMFGGILVCACLCVLPTIAISTLYFLIEKLKK